MLGNDSGIDEFSYILFLQILTFSYITVDIYKRGKQNSDT